MPKYDASFSKMSAKKVHFRDIDDVHHCLMKFLRIVSIIRSKIIKKFNLNILDMIGMCHSILVSPSKEVAKMLHETNERWFYKRGYRNILILVLLGYDGAHITSVKSRGLIII